MAKKTTTDHSQQTPYGGVINKNEQVRTGPHLLVSGPSGGGKTTGVLAPAAILWRGPRVIVSSKTDFLGWLVKKGVANRGPLYVLDLAGELHDDISWLKGRSYTRVTADPTALIENSDDAIAMATMLMQVGALGASDQAGGGGGDDGFWKNISTQPLAALLEAGKASGEGIGWTMRAASTPEPPEGAEPGTVPSWLEAYAYVSGSSIHADSLMALMAKDPKMRDSITATMNSSLTPWLLSTVRGDSRAVPFKPSMLEGPGEPTLAIIAPADGVAAGAAVAAIETVIRHWRRGIDRGLDRVLLAIDELVNTAPLPKLATYITEARGLGVAVVAAVQSTNQMKLRWGADGAEVLREVFPAVLVLPGAPERDMLEAAAWQDGEEDVQRESIDHNNRRSISTERVQRTTPTSLLPTEVGTARLIIGGRKGHLVQLPGVWLWPDKAA